jgi:hypothetical protein
MAGPGNEAAGGAPGYGHLRASHADREQAIAWLKAAFVQGRLAKDEFDSRVGQAFASRTYAELATVTADLPAGPAVAQPRIPAQAQGWLTMKRAVVCSACIWVVPTATASVIGWVAAGRLEAGPVFLVSILAFFMATVAAGTMIGEVWDKKKRSRGQLPHQPRREQGGQVLEGGQNGSPGDDLFPCEARRGTRARHLLGYDVTPRIWRSVRAGRKPMQLTVAVYPAVLVEAVWDGHSTVSMREAMV